MMVNKKELLEKAVGQLRSDFWAIIPKTKLEIEFQKDFDIEEKLSMVSGKGNGTVEHVLLSSIFNELAALWDDELLKNRKARARQGQIVVPPKHRFLLVPNRNPGAEAEMYNKMMQPDHRFVVIYMHRKRRKAIACALHEMGHFIGYRNRSSRMEKYFIPMLIDQLCRHVCELVLGSSIEDSRHNIYTINHSEDLLFSQETRDNAAHVIYCVASIRDAIETEFRTQLDSRMKELLSEDRTGGASEEFEAYVACVQAGFFCSLEAVMLSCFVATLRSEKLQQSLDQSINQIASEKEWSNNNDIQKRIREALEQIVREIGGMEGEPTKPWWYEATELVLEEPAADIFMLKMQPMSVRRYINLIVEEICSLTSEKRIDETMQWLSQPSLHLRIICIAAAMKAREKEIFGARERFALKFLPKDRMAYRKAEVRWRLLNMSSIMHELTAYKDEDTDKTLPDIYNPVRFLGQYVSELWNDNRYASSQIHMKKSKRLMRKVYRVRLHESLPILSWINWNSLKGIVNKNGFH